MAERTQWYLGAQFYQTARIHDFEKQCTQAFTRNAKVTRTQSPKSNTGPLVIFKCNQTFVCFVMALPIWSWFITLLNRAVLSNNQTASKYQ